MDIFLIIHVEDISETLLLEECLKDPTLYTVQEKKKEQKVHIAL